MSYSLYELHKMAYEAQIHQVKYTAGIMTNPEFSALVEPLQAHSDIVVEEVHEEHAQGYRDIIDGAINASKIGQ
jgi:hypothetical protein